MSFSFAASHPPSSLHDKILGNTSLCWREGICIYGPVFPTNVRHLHMERIYHVLYVNVTMYCCCFFCTLPVHSSYLSVIVASWFFPLGNLCLFFYLEYNGDIPFSMKRASYQPTVVTTLLYITGPKSCDTKVPYHLRKAMLHLVFWH